MNNQCRICINTSGNTPYVVREMMYGSKEQFPYFQCSSCGCLQITEPPKEISKYYPGEDYYSLQKFHDVECWRIRLKNSIKYCLFNAFLLRMGVFLLKHAPYIRQLEKSGQLGWLSLFRNIKKTASILDIGCGNGFFLREMNTWGYNNLTGIDPFIETDLFYSSGVKVFKQEVFNHQGQYDVIMLHHSFEHMDHPHLVLEHLQKLLHPKGILLIRIPVCDSYAWRKYGPNWFQIDAPRHFYLHTTKSMTHLSNNAGFVLKQVIYDSIEWQFLISEKYCNHVSFSEHMEFSSSFEKECKKHSRRLNKMKDGDQACFVFHIAE